jgi:hypothetical protein
MTSDSLESVRSPAYQPDPDDISAQIDLKVVLTDDRRGAVSRTDQADLALEP